MKRTALTTMIAGTLFAAGANAADWSDTSIGWRTGSKFAEPFEGDSISKNIFDLNHVSGYKYGTNFFNVDLLMSNANSKDPAGPQPSGGAQETYIVYRHTLSLGKVTGSPMFKFGPVRDVGIQAGFDYNTKDDSGYNSKKQMLVLGPTIDFDVKGFLELGVLEFWESNAPCSYINLSFGKPACVARYHYTPHPALSLAWGLPIGDSPFEFNGYGLWIASKGINEFGAPTVAETHFDMELMLDLGKVTGGSLKGFKIGLEYEYWQNKFGNDASIPASSPEYFAGGGGAGDFAHTPMIRAEYHF